MSMAQIGIALEILGFILASVFAMILLESGAVGSLADKLSKRIASTSDILVKNFPVPAPKALGKSAKIAINSVYMGCLVYLTVFLWNRIPWLFWINLFVLFALLFAPLLFAIFFSKDRLHDLKVSGEYLLGQLFGVPILLLTAGITLLQLVIKSLAGKDALKRAFLIFGSAMLFVGLILEFIATL